MPDREKVIERLGKVSYYFKSLLAVGWQGDADIYREHKESVNMALALLKDQQNTINCLIIAKEALFQAVEEQKQIVRCRDCKWYRQNTRYPDTNMIMDFCVLSGITGKEPDWFCADGERKEES